MARLGHGPAQEDRGAVARANRGVQGALLRPVVAARPDLGVAADLHTPGQHDAFLIGRMPMRRQAGPRRQPQKVGLSLLTAVQQLQLDARRKGLPASCIGGNGQVGLVSVGHSLEQAALDRFGLRRRGLGSRWSRVGVRGT